MLIVEKFYTKLINTQKGSSLNHIRNSHRQGVYTHNIEE